MEKARDSNLGRSTDRVVKLVAVVSANDTNSDRARTMALEA
jgi:hypothetical protein